MKLLLDEMYPIFISRELRARGHDVVSVHEAPGGGWPDDEVLDYASLLTSTPGQPVNLEIWLTR